MTDYKFRNNKYNSRNYVKVLEMLTPAFYIDEEIDVSGVGPDPLDSVTHSLIGICNISKELFGVSAYPPVYELGPAAISNDLQNPSAFAKFFIKQNKMTNFDVVDFDTDILAPLGYYLNDFNSSAEFHEFVSTTLLPMIQNGDRELVVTTASAYSNTTQGTHEHLLDKMGWFYILNMSGSPDWDYQPSSYVLNRLIDTVYQGDLLQTVDGVKGVANFIWRNTESSGIFKGLLPGEYGISGTDTYTSGIQQLEKLETLLDILYSPLGIDDSDTTVLEMFDSYYHYDSSAFTHSSEPRGPFYKFLKAISWSIAHTTNQVSKLSDLYNPDTCTDEMIVRLGDLLGVEFYGYDPQRWRLQVKNATNTYRRGGTKAGIVAGVDSIYGKDAFDVSSHLLELYESYIPDLLTYSLLTASPFFDDLKTWTRARATSIGIRTYSPSSVEENAKIVTDHILADLYTQFPYTFDSRLFNPFRFETQKRSGIATGPDETRNSLDPQARKEVYSLVHPDLTKPYTFLPLPADDSNTFEYNYALVHEWAITHGYNSNEVREAINASGPDGVGIYISGELLVGATHSYSPKSSGGAGGGGGLGGDGDSLIGSIDNGGNEQFFLQCKGSPDYIFNYRNYTNGFPLPPWEKKVYYQANEINTDLVDAIVNYLILFGCEPNYTNQLGTYIKNFTIADLDSSGIERAFSKTLFFTVEKQFPPNYHSIVSLPSSKKPEYLPMWNSKSSHFILDLKSNSFDFTKKTINSDGAQAPANVGRVVKQISPAKAIPLVALDASALDFDYHTDTDFTHGDMGMEDGLLDDQIPFSRGMGRSFRQAGYQSRTGFNMPLSYAPSSYERSGDEASPGEPGVEGDYGVGSNTDDGDAGHGSSLGFIPLALKPSQMQYVAIRDMADVHNLPDVYRASATITTQDITYNNAPLVTTFPCRGSVALGSDAKNLDIPSVHDKYSDRSDFQPIMAVMHELFESLATKSSEWYVRDTVYNPSALDPYAYFARSKWFNVEQSWANSAIHTFSWPVDTHLGLVSAVDYDLFDFGVGVAELFNHYVANLDNHDLGKAQLTNANAGVFSQTYGPLVYNANISIDGSKLKASPYLQASSFQPSAVVRINVNHGSGVLGTSGIGDQWGTTLVNGATDPLELPVPISGTLDPTTLDVDGDLLNTVGDINEFRNALILSGVELVDSSGADVRNNFQLFKRPKALFRRLENDYLGNNSIIKCKAITGLPRIRLDLADYGNIENYLQPYHQFSLNLSACILEESGKTFGGGSIGVWLHTEPIQLPSGGEYVFWSWKKDFHGPNEGSWRVERVNKLSKNVVVNELANIFTIEEEPTNTFTGGAVLTLGALSAIGPTGSLDYPASLSLVNQSFFKPTIFDFDTDELNTQGAGAVDDTVHSETRKYILEIFFVPRPGNETKYMLFDSIAVRDNTLFDAARLATGVRENPAEDFHPETNQKFVPITKTQLWTIIRHMKQNTEGANSNLSRNQGTRSRGLWEDGILTVPNTGDGGAGAVFIN